MLDVSQSMRRFAEGCPAPPPPPTKGYPQCRDPGIMRSPITKISTIQISGHPGMHGMVRAPAVDMLIMRLLGKLLMFQVISIGTAKSGQWHQS